MSFVGPGFLMSIAYLDPGNIAGDLQAGTDGGYQLIWTLLWATVLGWYYQVLSARIGVTTQRNLARLCHEQYSKKMQYTLWIMTEVAIIASDIQEVIGSATALNILFGIPLWAGAIITIFDSFLFLFIHYYGIRKLELFFAFLILIMTICFSVNMFAAEPDYGEIAKGIIIPRVPAGAE
jgi:NRAMP (natural resistance-associated macrophage protein)-like metal ion transporter